MKDEIKKYLGNILSDIALTLFEIMCISGVLLLAVIYIPTSFEVLSLVGFPECFLAVLAYRLITYKFKSEKYETQDQTQLGPESYYDAPLEDDVPRNALIDEPYRNISNIVPRGDAGGESRYSVRE